MTRKKGVGRPKSPVSKSRKARSESTVESSLQQSLIGEVAPAESHSVDSGMPLDAPDNEFAPAVDSVPVQSDQPVTERRVASDPGLISPAAPTWLLATNHLNLLYMLAAGMVMGPAGFSGKHYRDPSSQLPGLIPVFRDGVPEGAIQQAVSERKHLLPCIAELNLAGLAGAVALVSRNGEISSGALPLSSDSETSALLVRAPLPMALVKRLVFRSPADRKEFELSARSFANIDLTDLSIELSEQLFRKAHPLPWPLHGQPADTPQVRVDQPPARGWAIGGCLAMLYQLANRGDLGSSVYRIASGADTAEDGDAIQRDPVLAELGFWIKSGSPRSDSSVQAKLFWGAVQALVDARLSGSAERPVDTVLEYLDSQLTGLKESGYRYRLERLVSDMRSTFGLGGGTISQLFERNKGTLSRPLLLFCLRERCMELLDFSHPNLSEEELLVAAILFGVRDGWIGLPVELRTANGLSRFVEHRMFEAESGQQGGQLSFEPAPPRPLPLREVVVRSEGADSEVRHASLAKVVSRLGWHDCIVSRFRFPLGRYRMNVTANGIEVVVRGELSPPAVELDREGLMKRISRWPPLPRDHELELRAALSASG